MRLLLLLLFIQSCSLFSIRSDIKQTAKKRNYELHFKRLNWKTKKSDQSDYVFQHVKDGRIMLSNSFCHEFQEQDLKHLANKTTKGIHDFKEIDSRILEFKGRKAYQMTGFGYVDGIKISLILLNLKRDNCYYDFVAIAPAGTNDISDDFTNFLQSVEFK